MRRTTVGSSASAEREPTMPTVPFALALVPTLALLGLVGAYRVRHPRARAIWVAFALGALVTVPAWFAESAVEDPAAALPSLYKRAFVRQVLGAALVEEVALFLVLLAVSALFRVTAVTRPVDVVAVAVSGAVGFTTVDNLMAVAGSPEVGTAAGRLTSLFAGHATLQLVMGYFAARAFFGAAGGAWNLLPALALPFGIHGWGDFSEAVFGAEQELDPAGAAARNWFSAWIFGLFAYVASAAVVLWQLRSESAARRLGGGEASPAS